MTRLVDFCFLFFEYYHSNVDRVIIGILILIEYCALVNFMFDISMKTTILFREKIVCKENVLSRTRLLLC